MRIALLSLVVLGCSEPMARERAAPAPPQDAPAPPLDRPAPPRNAPAPIRPTLAPLRDSPAPVQAPAPEYPCRELDFPGLPTVAPAPEETVIPVWSIGTQADGIAGPIVDDAETLWWVEWKNWPRLRTELLGITRDGLARTPVGLDAEVVPALALVSGNIIVAGDRLETFDPMTTSRIWSVDLPGVGPDLTRESVHLAGNVTGIVVASVFRRGGSRAVTVVLTGHDPVTGVLRWELRREVDPPPYRGPGLVMDRAGRVAFVDYELLIGDGVELGRRPLGWRLEPGRFARLVLRERDDVVRPIGAHLNWLFAPDFAWYLSPPRYWSATDVVLTRIPIGSGPRIELGPVDDDGLLAMLPGGIVSHVSERVEACRWYDPSAEHCIVHETRDRLRVRNHEGETVGEWQVPFSNGWGARVLRDRVILLRGGGHPFDQNVHLNLTAVDLPGIRPARCGGATPE